MNLKHFKVQELVPKQVYSDRGELAIQVMDADLLTIIDSYTDYRKKPNLDKKVSVTVNNRLWGGTNQFRGLRTPDSKHYSKYSQHSFGRALDFDVMIDGVKIDAAIVRQWIIDNRSIEWVKPITFIEDGVNWVHVDTRVTDGELYVWHIDTKKTATYWR